MFQISRYLHADRASYLSMPAMVQPSYVRMSNHPTVEYVVVSNFEKIGYQFPRTWRFQRLDSSNLNHHHSCPSDHCIVRSSCARAPFLPVFLTSYLPSTLGTTGSDLVHEHRVIDYQSRQLAPRIIYCAYFVMWYTALLPASL